MDFNEHYILHWNFFKDVNKEADEEFFINLTLKKLRTKIDKEEITIDFNFDGKPNTTEQHLNERAKESFFFDKEYIKILEQKLKLLKETEHPKPAKENNMNTERDLDRMINTYSAYLFNCEYNFDNLDKIEKYSKQLYDKEIFNISHRASYELKDLAFNNNTHSKSIANYYFTKCRELLNRHNKNIKDNNLNNVKIMPKFIDYFDTIQPLYKFHDNALLLFPELDVSEIKTDKVKPPQQETKEKPATHLKDLFKDEANYTKIIDILVDNGFIEKDTLIWKDETNGIGQFVAGLIKVLYYKGYLNKKPTNKVIPIISKNTFQTVFSQSTSEKAKVKKDDSNYNMIPTVTEL